MDSKFDIEEAIRTSAEAVGEAPRDLRALTKASIDVRSVRADATWQASSFDLAQGLDVKVMQSKLSPETLDRLFRG